MKKLLLKINLLNFILTTPMLVLFNNYNQSFSKNYMEQQTTNSTWTNGTYHFSYKKRNLFVRKEGISNISKISGFEGTISESYFSYINNDVLFTTDKGLLLIKEGSTEGLKISGAIGQIASIAFKEKSKDILILTKEGILFVVKEGSTEALKVDNVIGTIERISFNKENKVTIYTNEDFFTLEEGSTTATRIDSVTKFFMELALKESFDKSFYKNLMEQQTTTLGKVKTNWSNDAYQFLFFQKQLYVRERIAAAKSLKVDGLDGKEVKDLIFIRKNDVIIFTDGGLFILWEGKINALKVDGLDGEIDKIVVSDPDDKIFIYTSKSSFILNYPSTVLKTDNLIVKPRSWFLNMYKQVVVVRENNEEIGVRSCSFNEEVNFNFIYVDNNLYIVKKDSNKALKIDGINGKIKCIAPSTDNSFFIVTTEALFLIKEGSTKAIKQS